MALEAILDERRWRSKRYKPVDRPPVADAVKFPVGELCELCSVNNDAVGFEEVGVEIDTISDEIMVFVEITLTASLKQVASDASLRQEYHCLKDLSSPAIDILVSTNISSFS